VATVQFVFMKRADKNVVPSAGQANLKIFMHISTSLQFVYHTAIPTEAEPLLLPFERWHISGKRSATHKFNSNNHASIRHCMVLQDVKPGAGNCYHCLSVV
jgi:hypothetical protein